MYEGFWSLKFGITWLKAMSFIFHWRYIFKTIMIIIVGLKDLAKPNPFYIKRKAHAEKEETFEDE